MTDGRERWATVDVTALERVPSVHAVVAFFDECGACVLLAATGDARSFCEKRLSAEVCGPARVEMLECGSMFEAELAYLHEARRLMPGTYAGLIDAWRAWFLRLDLARGVWSATNLHEFGPGVHVGPMPDKHAPGKLGELIDDVFDLCRYPAELAKAPGGRACAYKEMGRCPGPCDGTEAWDSFAARFAEAAGALGSLETLRRVIEARMREAAAASAFERAAHLQERARALGKRGQRGLVHMGHLEAFARVAVVPRAGGGAGVYLCRADGVRAVGALNAKSGREDAAEVLAALGAVEPLGAAFEPSVEQREELGLVTRRLFMARRAEEFLSLEDASYADGLMEAAERRASSEPEGTA